MSDRIYYAHTPNDQGQWQTMEAHTLGEMEKSDGVAILAREFAQPFGAGDLAYAAGLLHDAGKYSDQFQDYLQRCWQAKQAGHQGKVTPGGGDHKRAGAHLSYRLFNPSKPNMVGMTVLGHHGGLSAWHEVKNEAPNLEEEERLEQCIARALNDIPALRDLTGGIALPPAVGKNEVSVEMFVRMLFSCLVDADSLDTEQHFNLAQAHERGRKASLRDWEQRLRDNQEALQEVAAQNAVSKLEQTVCRIRREVYEYCLEAASLPQGAFQLTVPTGGGKTRASLAFALAHANQADHPLNRIIYAIPYTSIIDQTAQVFREILGEDAPILVHHSALPDEEKGKPGEEEGDGESSWRRLAAQNWDAPLILTTTVQLFESLFACAPSRCRKLHNIANSVIILDEAQTLPLTLLKPILDGLKILVRYYGVTVVFCTATQPAFEIMAPHLKGFKEIRDIVPQPERHFRDMKRVHYTVQPDKWNWQRVAEEMQSNPKSQCLTVVNTRADALKLLEALRQICGEDNPAIVHLSTLLCGAHRQDVLKEIKRRLKAGEPCLLASTQVIEAGVDVDFARALRAIGPFDRIVQAAGRCNREGKAELGEVTVFFPEGGGMPPDTYRTATEQAKILLKSGEVDFDDPAVCTRYFESLYHNVNTDAFQIQELRKALDYPKVASAFRLIDSPTKPVLVCYEPERERYEEVLAAATAGRVTRQVWQRAQPLLVNLFENDIRSLKQSGKIRDILPRYPDTLFAWQGNYDNVEGMVGVTRDPVDPIYAPDKLIA